jgi:hypothetical protein
MKTTIPTACFFPRSQRALAGVPTVTGSRRPVGMGRAAHKLASPLAPGGISLASLLTVSIFAANVAARADTLTLSAAPAQHGTAASQSFSVPTNVTAQIVYAHCPTYVYFSSWITVSITGSPGGGAYYSSPVTSNPAGTISNLPTVVGPATITLWATNSGYTDGSTTFFCTIQTTSSTSFNPSSAVVIPNDSGGPVTVILESSVDLVNWTPALPGTYGTTTSNRFFRVRAQR